jgi:hypothetical protein
MPRKKTLTEEEKRRRKYAYDNQYHKDFMRRIYITFSNKNDADIIEYLDAHKPYIDTIRKAIRNLMKQTD